MIKFLRKLFNKNYHQVVPKDQQYWKEMDPRDLVPGDIISFNKGKDTEYKKDYPFDRYLMFTRIRQGDSNSYCRVYFKEFRYYRIIPIVVESFNFVDFPEEQNKYRNPDKVYKLIVTKPYDPSQDCENDCI